jgi:hypothetical protein
MTTRGKSPRRYRKSADRRVWVFSELNHDVTPEAVAKILTAAGLQQARREASAQAERDQIADGGDDGAHHV